MEGFDGQWKFFTEGTAVLVSSVAQPEIQFATNAIERAYIVNANLFIGTETISGDLGKSFENISPYHAAIYWRFLYEQCGGMVNGNENPSAGMSIIRRSLVSLYQTIGHHDGQKMNFDAGITEIMNLALDGSACPFQTYQQSLDAFYRALDQLGTSGGRCEQPGIPHGCGFFDPNHLYYSPTVNAVVMTHP